MSPSKPFRSLSKKLVVLVLLTSTAITTILTSFSFYLDYSEEMNMLENSFNQIKNSSVGSISRLIYEFDDEGIAKQANDILRVKDIIAVKILNESNELIHDESNHSASSEYTYEATYPLIVESNNSTTKLGTITITATKTNMYKRLARKLFYFFISQGLKTLAVSFLMLIIFNKMVTRYLIDLSKFARSFELNEAKETKKLELFKPSKFQDEIDGVFECINNMIEYISKINREDKLKILKKEKMLDKQEAIMLQSIRMASLGEMAGSIAHQINNPLAIISGNIRRLQYLVEEKNLDPKLAKTICIKMNHQIERVGQIIQGLLLFSKEDSRQGEEEFTMDQLFSAVKNIINEKMIFHKIAFNIELNKEMKNQVLIGSLHRVTHVIINLLDNAIEATKDVKDKKIKVKSYLKNNHIRIEIIDNGIGVSEENEDKIFIPFFSTKKCGQGVGLGLSIANSIMEEHNGTLSYEKSPLQTKFRVELPKAS